MNLSTSRRYFFSVAALLFATISAFGQINVGTTEYGPPRAGDFAPGDLDKLKAGKTIFIYGDKDLAYLDELKSTLKNAWKVNELDFMSFSDFQSTSIDPANAYFTINVYQKILQSSSPGMDSKYTYIYLDLWMKTGKKEETRNYARIDLFVDYATLMKAEKEIGGSNEKQLMKHLNNEAIIYNWNVLYLKNALQFVSSTLIAGQTHALTAEIGLLPELQNLKTETLYVPDYTFRQPGAPEGSGIPDMDPLETFKKYPYSYKVVSMKELEEIARSSTSPVYYLSYVRSYRDKFVSVIDATTGEFLYSLNTGMSLSIKSKDIALLLSKMK